MLIFLADFGFGAGDQALDVFTMAPPDKRGEKDQEKDEFWGAKDDGPNRRAGR